MPVRIDILSGLTPGNQYIPGNDISIQIVRRPVISHSVGSGYHCEADVTIVNTPAGGGGSSITRRTIYSRDQSLFSEFTYRPTLVGTVAITARFRDGTIDEGGGRVISVAPESEYGVDFDIMEPVNQQTFGSDDTVRFRMRMLIGRSNVNYEFTVSKVVPGVPAGDEVGQKTLAAREFAIGGFVDIPIPAQKIGKGYHTLIVQAIGHDKLDIKTRSIQIEIGRTIGTEKRFSGEEIPTEVKGTGPKRFYDVGRGALATKGVTDEKYGKRAPHATLRGAITFGKMELGRLAKRRAMILEQELRVQIDRARQEWTRERDARRELDKYMRRIIRTARNSTNDILQVVQSITNPGGGMGAARTRLGELMGERAPRAGYTGPIRQADVTGDAAAFMIAENYKRLEVAERALYEEMRRQMRAEELYTELSKALANEADRISKRLIWRLRLNADFRNNNDMIQSAKEFVEAELKNEAERLALFYQSTFRNWARRTLGRITMSIGNVSDFSQSLGDIWSLITHNLWALLTGPWILGLVFLFLQYMMVFFYNGNYMFIYTMPLLGAGLLFLLNSTNTRYPMDVLTFLISGAIIGYDAVILIIALHIDLFVSTFWLWMIFLILGFLGAFQIFGPGGFNALVPITIAVIVFGYFAMGPYSQVYQRSIDEIQKPLKSAYDVGRSILDNVILLATNPTEWYAKQQMVNVRPERPMDYPKALEIQSIEGLPETTPKGERFSIVVIADNKGDLPVTDIEMIAGCNEFCNSGGASASLGRNTLRPGEATRFELRDIIATGFEDSANIDKSAWISFAKVSVNISYSYSTKSNLLVEIMTDEEIQRKFRAEEKVFRPIVSAVGKVGPGQVSLNVGPQPLKSGSDSLLLASISNSRFDGFVRLSPGDNIIIKLPPEVGTGLVCSNSASSGFYDCITTIDEDGVSEKATCTMHTEHDIPPFKFNAIVPFLCKFTSRSDIATSATGLIRAELPHYRFILQKEKDIQVTPPMGIVKGEDTEGLVPGVGAGVATWPSSVQRISTCFGATGSQWSLGYHTGMDISNPGSGDVGEPVYAVYDGEVVGADLADCHLKIGEGGGDPYGSCIKIKHKDSDGNTFYTFYAHLESITQTLRSASRDKSIPVKAGEQIGTIGYSGFEDPNNAHLHFEVRTGENGGFRDFIWPCILFPDKCNVKDGRGRDCSKCPSNLVEKCKPDLLHLGGIATQPIAGSVIEKIVIISREHNVPEDLALAVAEQESSLEHYNPPGSTTVKVSRDGGVGLMQITNSPNAHPGCFTPTITDNICKGPRCSQIGKNPYDIECNIESGIKLLNGNYENGPKVFPYRADKPTYRGWQLALRKYNGWGAGGDPQYVEHVEPRMSKYQQYRTVSNYPTR